MNKQAFYQAIEFVKQNGKKQSGIGTLSERSVHAVLKKYYEPFSDSHEIKLGRYIADIVGENGIIEIQTAQLFKLKDKLKTFIPCCRTTVVYPLIAERRIVKCDIHGNKISARKSPLKLNPYNAFEELYPLREFISDENFRFCICIIKADVFKAPGKTTKGKTKNNIKSDTVPTELIDEIYLNSPRDYFQFIPENLPEKFTSADFSETARISKNLARTFLNTVTAAGCAERCGKSGNNILFRITR